MSQTTRREILKSSAAALLLPAMARPAGGATRLYAGSYSSPQGPEGSVGRGEGIYLFEMNPANGALSGRQVFADTNNPSWIAFHPSKKYLYAANEIQDYENGNSGAVSAYRVDAGSGALTKLNTVSSHGAGPAHLSVHPSGKYVFVANYGGGSFAVLSVSDDGQLGPATDVKNDIGTVGPQRAVSAPKGSFAISGHDRGHAHMIESDPAGKFVLGTNLGFDDILVWGFDARNGLLVATAGSPVKVPPGDGPRHFAFHPNGRWFYSLQEEGSTLIVFDYDPAKGTLTKRQQLSSLPDGFAGTNFTSEVRISRDGRFLYAANRLHDSIAWFSIDATGRLQPAGETWTRGDYPRSFTLDPSGNFLFCCNQRADAITTFRVNRKTGALTFTGDYTPVGTPAVIAFA